MSRNRMKSLFGKGFTAANCKLCLEGSVFRLKVMRHRVEAAVMQGRLDLAQFLEHGQETKALRKAEILYRDENTLAAYDLIEDYCSLVANHLPILLSQRLCPPDLKHAVSGLIYAASRCAELQELQTLRKMLRDKYGRDFVTAAEGLRPDCGVSRQIIEKLSLHSPTWKVKIKLMKEVAAENKIGWAPAEQKDEPDGFGSRISEAIQLSMADIGGNTSVSKPAKANDNLPNSSIHYSVDTRDDVGVPQERVSSSAKHDKGTPIITSTHNAASERESNSSTFCQIHGVAEAESRIDYGDAGNDANLTEVDEMLPRLGGTYFDSLPKGSDFEYQDITIAAKLAYECAAQAAMAAEIALDLLKCGGTNLQGMVAATNFQ